MGRKKDLTPPEQKPLTRRQEKFVKELVANDGLITMREAAIRAGTNSCSAHSRAFEMGRMPDVSRAITQYRAELDAMYAVTYKRSERDLKIIRDASLASGAFSAAVQSEVARGRLAGLYTSKSEIRSGSLDINTLSREEVEIELNRIRASFGEVIDVTPEEKETASEEHRGGALAAIADGNQEDAAADRIDAAGELGDTGSS